MEYLSILTARDLLREEPTPERCAEMLQGVSFAALQRYAALFCHNLALADESGAPRKKFFAFQTWFLHQATSERFRDRLLGLLSHRRAFQGNQWVLADQHRVAHLVMAYARANAVLVPGLEDLTDGDRLVRAQLIVNDLVSIADSGSRDTLSAAQILQVFATARAWSAKTTMPRAYDIIGLRLKRQLPDIEHEMRAAHGVGFDEAAVVLLVLYLGFLTALSGDGGAGGAPLLPWTRGALMLAGSRLPGSAKAVMRRVTDLHATTWDQLRKHAAAQPASDPSILYFLRHPLILSAASTGLLWLAKVAHEAAGGDGQAVFRALGLAFQEYLSDFLTALRGTGVESGDAGGAGFSDFYLIEDRTLLAIEAKAAVLRDAVKWSGSMVDVRSELAKLLKNNQVMRATERYLARRPELAKSVDRVLPVFVVLDPAFACPELEAEVIAAVTKPAGPPNAADPHQLFVGALEAAGNYVRAGALGKLLDVRRRLAPGGWVGLDEVIGRHRAQVESQIGAWFEPYDAHVATRDAVNEAMQAFKQGHEVTASEGSG